VEQVFRNETIDLNYEMVDAEERWTSVGHTLTLKILVAVWTMREGAIRTVTAFEAGKPLATEYMKKRVE
jgi:uncharacterized DUF497 family protein